MSQKAISSAGCQGFSYLVSKYWSNKKCETKMAQGLVSEAFSRLEKRGSLVRRSVPETLAKVVCVVKVSC